MGIRLPVFRSRPVGAAVSAQLPRRSEQRRPGSPDPCRRPDRGEFDERKEGAPLSRWNRNSTRTGPSSSDTPEPSLVAHKARQR